MPNIRKTEHYSIYNVLFSDAFCLNAAHRDLCPGHLYDPMDNKASHPSNSHICVKHRDEQFTYDGPRDETPF